MQFGAELTDEHEIIAVAQMKWKYPFGTLLERAVHVCTVYAMQPLHTAFS